MFSLFPFVLLMSEPWLPVDVLLAAVAVSMSSSIASLRTALTIATLVVALASTEDYED